MDGIEKRFHGYHQATRTEGRGSRATDVSDAAFFFGFVLAASCLLLRVAWPFLPLWPAAFALGGLFVWFFPAYQRSTLCAGVRVDERGVRRCVQFGVGPLYRWDDMQDVTIDEHGATVRTSRGDLRLGSDLSDWLLLARQCQRAIGAGREPEPEAIPDLPPEEVARWLGVSAGGELLCTSGYFRRAALALVLAVVLPLLLLLTLFRVPSLLFLLVPSLISGFLVHAMFIAPVRRGRRIREVRATPTELDVRTDSGWRKYAWGSLHSLVQRGMFRVVSTADGDIMLPPFIGHAGVLLGAIRKAIAARASGLALPRMSADVPDAALSRVEAGEVSGERGLSRADEEA